AQGWPAATAAGQPWVLGPCSKQPHRGCAQIADDWRNTFGVENAFLNFVPRVGRSSQPLGFGAEFRWDSNATVSKTYG
ncbi:MAG: hypothetical protein ACI8QF_003712, partial [Limisphaerales bacterium]